MQVTDYRDSERRFVRMWEGMVWHQECNVGPDN